MTSDERRDLIVFPCCGSKEGTAQEVDARFVSDYVGKESADMLAEGRRLAFECSGTSIELLSPRVPALALYTGNPYKVRGFREHILQALDVGTHCVIVSAGYGLLRPEEPIHRYNARIQVTRKIWLGRLCDILCDYITRNMIRRAFVSCSRDYAQLLFKLPQILPALDLHWNIPRVPGGQGAQVKVPKRVGEVVVGLIASNMRPDESWGKTPPNPRDGTTKGSQIISKYAGPD